MRRNCPDLNVKNDDANDVPNDDDSLPLLEGDSPRLPVTDGKKPPFLSGVPPAPFPPPSMIVPPPPNGKYVNQNVVDHTAGKDVDKNSVDHEVVPAANSTSKSDGNEAEDKLPESCRKE